MAISLEQFLRAWRLAGFANHQWSRVPWDRLLGKVKSKGSGFYFDGLDARQWAGLAAAMTYLLTVPGPAGWGIVAPEADNEGNLVVRIGAGVEAIFSPDRYSISYRNPHRGVEITVLMPLRRILASGPLAPRDWARIARLVLEAEGMDLISGVVPPEVRKTEEYRKYFTIHNAGHLLAAPYIAQED